MLTDIMFVTIYVTDQDRALEFYTERLGLEKRIDVTGPEGRFLTVGVPGNAAQIILWPHAAGAEPGPIVLESEDLRKDFEVMRQRGVAFDRSEPEDYPFGVRIGARDPDGNLISLREQSKR
ncbi:VOC family protein [Nocardia pseudobrasiliensis]|uniref:Catechol 2,3-dioxygenase-like lactoylglutathione lyase family enzyme n=1 Tax=Nocardia pseudobrasiliensis TaxID=45979 RepID=A0A370I639_9NOCA|nr:VOC family protein [Nocardia pseudobrasiliensis]RDI65581.1 catechol 2,3-dioxygenase-like lactoylglutathione lyase family enzyme [Nocardia pseudobrasiliensis]